MKLNVGIIGVTGYTGQELLKYLKNHSEVTLAYLAARRLEKPTPAGDLLPAFREATLASRQESLPPVEKLDVSAAASRCDLIFCALPHGLSMKILPKLLSKNKKLEIIDLGGDFRLKAAAQFKQAYGLTHTAAPLLKKSVYGLTEWCRNKLFEAPLIANPGCYPTAALLGLGPLAQKQLIKDSGLIVDAKSGVTGAGRSIKPELQFSQVNENFKPYGVDQHQHIPEMEQELKTIGNKGISMTFVPHLIPINRGLIATIYAPLKSNITEQKLHDLYQEAYSSEPFVRLLESGSWPELSSVAHTNFCDIGLTLDRSKKTAIIVSAIDNLGKGAAGQAIQNMNISRGFSEILGLVT